MIRKLSINELEKGMYVSGFEKEGAENALFFMNSLLIRNKKDLEEFMNYGYRSAYVVVDDHPVPSITEKKMHIAKRDDNAEVRSDRPKMCGQAASDDFAKAGALEFWEGDVEEPSMEDAAAVYDACVDETVPQVTQAAAVEKDTAPVGPFATVEVTGGVAGRTAEASAEDDPVEIKNAVEFSEELRTAKAIRAEAENLAREFMNDVYQKNDINTEKVNRTVEDMVESIFRNRDALTSLVRLKSADDYTFAHCVNVAVLALTIGRQMRLDRSELQDLGVGAVLHDVGKMLVSQGVLKKPGPLTSAEFGEMKRHTELGAELLSRTGGISEDSVFVALQHHEKFDGTGYPGQKSGSSIHLYARIAAVADVYDAMTSNRVYQKKMPPDIALQKMYTWRDANFEPTLVEWLIKCLGIYPIGTIVELNTGEIALVKATNHTNPLQPRLLMLFDENKRQVRDPYELDLKTEVARWVVNSRDPNKLGVNIDPIIA